MLADALKGKYKLRIRGFILPVENKGKDFPFLHVLKAFTLENLKCKCFLYLLEMYANPSKS